MMPTPTSCMTGTPQPKNESGPDVGLVAWFSNKTFKWIIIDTAAQAFPFDCIISFNGDTLKPIGYAVHGYPAWVGSTYCIYRAPGTGSYIAMPRGMLGHYKPIDESLTISFWVYDGIDPHIGTYAHKGQASIDVTANLNSWDRWESSTQFGVYTAVGPSASGSKKIGLPNWKSDMGDHTRSLGLAEYDKYKYTGLNYDPVSERYVIGAVGAETGWWVGDEPNPGYNRTFSFVKPEGSEITGSSIVLGWDGYVKGDSTSAALVGEAAIWRI